METHLLSAVLSVLLLADNTKALAKKLVDRDPAVVLATIQTLGDSGKAEAVPLLCTVLRDGSPTLRQAAATALGHLRLAKALMCLAAEKEDQEPEVKKAVQLALMLGVAEAPNRFFFIDSQSAGSQPLTPAQVNTAELAIRKQLSTYRMAQSFPGESAKAVTALLKARKLKNAMQLRITFTNTAEKFTAEIMGLSFPDMALRGSWRVGGSGGDDLQELMDAVLPKVADDTAHDLDLK